MTERHRITRFKLTTTQSGKPIAELYDRDTRLEYPVLRLFDLSMLTDVGIDASNLEPETLIHCNFWAHWELSEKTNQRGNPYKDVISLEPIHAPATTTSTDTSAIVAELRAIKALLLQIATGSQNTQSPISDPDPPDVPDPNQVAQAQRLHALQQAGRDPTSVASAPSVDMMTASEARTEFYRIAGIAIAIAQADPQAINDLVREANGEGWPAALDALREMLKGD